MNKQEGDITLADAEAVSVLNLSFEWQRHLPDAAPVREIGGLEYFKNLETLDLSFHEITNITPLEGLSKLAVLSLRGNPVEDISPLAGLTDLIVLTLDHSAVIDLSPLASLAGIKHLYLAECPVVDYSPLADIYPNLESKDFIIAFTLEELGFVMDDNNKTAWRDIEGASVTVNHSEWGTPPMEMEANSIRMRMQFDGGWLTVGYHAEIQTYVFAIDPNDGGHIDYIYEAAKDNSFGDAGREGAKQAILAVMGDTDTEDILMVPIQVFDDRIRAAFGMTADALYALPFGESEVIPEQMPEQTTPAYAPPYEPLGFTANEDEATCLYEKSGLRISIHKAEWGVSPEEWNIEFHDPDVNGYSLITQYFADEGKWHVYMEKGGAYCAYDDYPATDAKGWEDPSIEAVHQMVGDAFHSQGKELYYKPLEYFERVVQELFGMSVDELYALSKQ